MPSLTSGDSLGPRYTLIRRLGAGAAGEVWLVEDRELQVEVAAKIVRDPTPRQLERLRQEWRLTRRLTHPGVVRIFDFEQLDDLAVLTMEHVEGRDLGHWLGAEPEKIVALTLPVVDALDFSHLNGVVHGDIRLGNVLVDREGRTRLLGFGIADLSADGLRSGGSPAGASPQQLEGAAPQSSDDVYGFGTLLYELISGRPPLWPDLSTERILSRRPDRVRSPHPLPEGLQALVADLLEKSPEDRPGDMREVGDRLRGLQLPTAELPAAGATVLTPPPTGRRPESAPPVRLTPPPRISAAAPTRGGEPLAAPQPPPDESRDRRLRWATGIAFAVLVAAAITVFAVLPEWVAPRSQPPAAEDGIAAPGPSTSSGETDRSIDASGESEEDPEGFAREAGATARERIRELESRAAPRWAGEEFASLKAEVRTAEQQILEGDFEAAGATYRGGLAGLEAIEARASEALDKALRRGATALSRGDSASAHEAFELAGLIDPGNSTAAAGLRKAEALPALLAHLDAGAERERRGDLQGALSEYRRAKSIEPASPEARTAIDRLTRRVADADYASAMAEGFTALESGAYAEARQGFERARTMRPDSVEANEGLERAAEGLRTVSISDHRSRAAAAAVAEDWHTAATHYGQILELDPSLAFAQQGQAQSRARAELGDELSSHLEHLERLSTPGVLSEARETLERAQEVGEPGALLTRQVDELGRSVAAYSTAVDVVLRSDDLTEIEIYRVGRLGSFTQRSLELLPGTYTVIGRRSGYQDVRLRLEVPPGEAPDPVTVRCEAKI